MRSNVTVNVNESDDSEEEKDERNVKNFLEMSLDYAPSKLCFEIVEISKKDPFDVTNVIKMKYDKLSN